MYNSRIPQKAIDALLALKAQAYYAEMLLVDDEEPSIKPANEFTIGTGHTFYFGTSAKGKSFLPRYLLEKIQEKMKESEPYTSQIVKSLLRNDNVSIDSADAEWLKTIII